MSDEPTVASLLEQIPDMIAKENRSSYPPVRLQLKLSGSEAGSWLLDIQSGKCLVTPGQADHSDLTFSLDSDLFKELVAGNIHPMKVFMNGEMQVVGNLPLAMQIANIFQS